MIGDNLRLFLCERYSLSRAKTQIRLKRQNVQKMNIQEIQLMEIEIQSQSFEIKISVGKYLK